MSSKENDSAGGVPRFTPTSEANSESKPSSKQADPLLPSETIQKLLISTTSRVVAEYKTEGMVITHAWPDLYRAASTARMQEGPLSRSGLLVAFETEPEERKAGSVRPDYSPWGEVVCAYLSVLFGKRFDSHGLVEGSGLYRIPQDLRTTPVKTNWIGRPARTSGPFVGGSRRDRKWRRDSAAG